MLSNAGMIDRGRACHGSTRSAVRRFVNAGHEEHHARRLPR